VTPRTEQCPFVFAPAVVGMGLSKRTVGLLSKLFSVRIQLCSSRGDEAHFKFGMVCHS